MTVGVLGVHSRPTGSYRPISGLSCYAKSSCGSKHPSQTHEWSFCSFGCGFQGRRGAAVVAFAQNGACTACGVKSGFQGYRTPTRAHRCITTQGIHTLKELQHQQCQSPTATRAAQTDTPSSGVGATGAASEAFPGLIPQTDTVPNGSEVEYLRTTWSHGESRRARGFSRETSKYKQTAVTFDRRDDRLDPPETIAVSEAFEKLQTVSSAEDHAETVSLTAQGNLESWSASPSVSLSLSRTNLVNSSAVTVTYSRSFLSEDVPTVNVTERNDLNNDAIDFLNRNGPVAFEKKFGSHYIVGYNVGGVFNGFVQFQYDSVAAAESARLGVESSVVQLNEDDGSVEGAFDGDVTLEATISNKTQNSSHRASYSAVGWNTLAPDSKGDIAAPVVVTDLDSMLKAAELPEEVSVEGREVEALLAPYADLVDYQRGVGKYERDERRKGREPDVLLPLPEDKYKTIAHLLNTEFLRLDFLQNATEGILNAARAQATSDLQHTADKLISDAFCAQDAIRDMFSTTPKARDNWLALAAYIDYVKAQTAAGVIHNPDEPITTPVAGRNTAVTEQGRLLANMAFRFKDLDVQYQAFLEDVAQEIPKIV